MSDPALESPQSSAESATLRQAQPARWTVPSVAEVLFGTRPGPQGDLAATQIKLQSR